MTGKEADIESAVIGGLLVNRYTLDAGDVLASTPEEAFTVTLHRKVYREIKNRATATGMIDGFVIAESVEKEYFSYVMDMVAKFPKAANLKAYAAMLNGYHRVRQFVEKMEVCKQSIDGSRNHTEALAAIHEFLPAAAEIDDVAGAITPVHIGELMDRFTDLLSQRLKNGEESTTLKVGIPELDEITGGINPVDLVIVAARPGCGKTEFALRVARGVAEQTLPGTDRKRGVLIFCMEMDASQIIERQIADAGNLPVADLRKPARMDDEAWAKVSNGIGRLTGLDVWIVDVSALNVEEIRAITERHKCSYPDLSLVMVDYLSLIKKPTAERNDLAIGHISGSLKRMAKELKTPVISLSQLSRDVEKRPNKRPVNADLRDSGSVEQDADSIIMLYRDAMYNPESTAAPYAEIIVTKNRFGQTGTVYQIFKNGHFLPTDQKDAMKACRKQTEQMPPRRYAKGANV